MKSTISASDMVTYYTCPRKYYFTAVKEMPINPNPIMQLGTIQHKIHQDFFEKELHSNPEMFKAYIEETIPKMADNKVFEVFNLNKEELVKNLQRSVRLLMENFNKSSITKPKKDSFEKKLPYGEYSARCDCIYEEDGEEVIGDLKTEAKVKPEYRLQIAMNSKLLKALGGKDIKKGKIVGHKNWEAENFEIEEEDRKLLNEILLNMQNLRKNPILPKVKYNPYICKYCDFCHLCNVEGEDRTNLLKEELAELPILGIGTATPEELLKAQGVPTKKND